MMLYVLGLDVVVALLKLTRFHTCWCTSSSACPITIKIVVPVPLPSSYCLVPTTLSPRILHCVCNTQMLLGGSAIGCLGWNHWGYQPPPGFTLQAGGVTGLYWN